MKSFSFALSSNSNKHNVKMNSNRWIAGQGYFSDVVLEERLLMDSALSSIVNPVHTKEVDSQIKSTQRSLISLSMINMAFQVPGNQTTNTELVFQLNRRNTAYRSEIGYYLVDGLDGRIGNLLPGNPGYANAAMEQAHTLFPKGSRSGTVSSVTVPGGTYYATYLISNGTRKTYLKTNPDNLSGRLPNAFFSIAKANPDRYSHLRLTPDGRHAWEDTWRGGDRDHNDAVLKVSYRSKPISNTPPSVRIDTPNEGALSNRNVTISGQGLDDQRISKIFGQFDGISLFEIPKDAQGKFSVSTTYKQDGTEDGLHNIQIVAIDSQGIPSQIAVRYFSIDTVRPNSISSLNANTITVTFSESMNPAQLGGAQNYFLTSSTGSQLAVGQIQVVNDKTVTIELPQNLSPGSYNFTVQSTVNDLAGNAVLPGSVLPIIITAPDSISFPTVADQRVTPGSRLVIPFGATSSSASEIVYSIESDRPLPQSVLSTTAGLVIFS